jgi:hypothetical protein
LRGSSCRPSSHRALHLELDETVHLDRKLERKLLRDRLDETGHDHRGRFQRSPLIIDEKDIRPLKKALAEAPKLRQLLARLVGG